MQKTMKRLLAALLVMAAMFSLAACGTNQEPDKTPEAETVTVKNAAGEDVTVHVNPKKVAIFEPTALDIINYGGYENTGIEKLGVQKTDSSLPDYLSDYLGDDFVNVGNLFEADYDSLDLLDPDLIIYGSRFGTKTEGGDIASELKEKYPNADILYYEVDSENFTASLEQNVETLGKIFPGIKDKINSGLEEVKSGMAKVRENAADAKSLFLMIGGNYITYYGDTGRFAMVHNDFGFTSVDTTTEVTGFHGAEVNAEYVMTQNPEVILLLNRDAAIGSEESASATDAFLNNDMIQKTTAYKNDNIIQLDPVAWYINPGGITSTLQMIEDLMMFTR